MSGVKTWNLFYSDFRRRAELCIREQRVVFLNKKRERKKDFKNRHTRTHTHAYT